MLSEEGKKVKEQLEQLRQAKRNIHNLQQELKWWQEMSDFVASSSFNIKVQGGQAIPYAEKRVIKIDELECKISEAIDIALKLEDEFLRNCSQLDSLSQNLLYERYLTGKPLKKIIKEFAYSERHVFRLYDDAFENVAKSKKIKDVTKCQ